MPTKISNSSKCQFQFQGPKLGEVTDERQSVISELAGQINFGIAILALLFFLATIVMPCCLRKPKRAVYVRVKEQAEQASPEPAEQASPEPAEKASPEPAEKASPEPAEREAPEPAEKASPELAEREEPEPAEKASPEPAEKASPEPAERKAPEPGTVAPTQRPPRPPTPQPAPASEEILPEPYSVIPVYEALSEPGKAEEEKDWRALAAHLMREVAELTAQTSRQNNPDYQTRASDSWTFYRPLLGRPTLPPPPPPLPSMVRKTSLPPQRRVPASNQSSVSALEQMPSWARRRDLNPAWAIAEELRLRDQRPPWARARDETPAWTRTEDELERRPRDQRPPWVWDDQDHQAETQV